MADPTNAKLKSFLANGFKPNDLRRVGFSLREEIQERADQVSSVSGTTVTLTTNLSTFSGNLSTFSGNLSTLSGNLSTLSGNLSTLSGVVNDKASISGATFSGAVTFISGLTTSGNVTITGTTSVSGVFTAASGVNFTLANYADDATASGGGIAIGQLYRNGSVVQVRVS